MPKPVLRIVSPDTVKRKVTPRRPKNAEVRTREYLTEREVEQLIGGCKDNRRPHRDQTMILLAFRHGLRASEVDFARPQRWPSPVRSTARRRLTR